MRRHENHGPHERLARLAPLGRLAWMARLTRLARWLGLDRNPLRRGTDRVEAVLRLVTVVLLVAVVPAAAVIAGQRADQRGLRQAQAQRAADHLVTAVLLRDAQEAGMPDPYSAVQTTMVPARWQLPGHPSRTGEVLAVVGARKGSTVEIWVDSSGAKTDPPLRHSDIVGSVYLAVVMTLLVSWLALFAVWVIARRILNRRRFRAWDAEWRATGPLGTGRPG